MMMSVLYVKGSGHVMAAFTRATDSAATSAPAAPEPTDAQILDAPATADVLAVAGGELSVRGFSDAAGATLSLNPFAIPAQQLMALSLPRDDAPLLAPRLYAVADGKKLSVLPAASGLALTVAAGTPRTLDLTVPATASGPTRVAIFLVPTASAAGVNQVFSTTFTPSGGFHLSFTSSVPLSGTYDALILVQGFMAVALQVSV